MTRLSTVTTVMVLLLLGFSTPASSSTIYSVTNTSSNSQEPLCLGQSCFSQILMASWIDTVAFNNVSIYAEVGGDDTSASLTAYLMNAVGPGTTAANQIASVTLTPTSYDSSGTLLFSGENLGPGTYYVVLSGPAVETSFSYWYEYDSATVTTAAGVSGGGFGMANSVDSSSSPNSSYAPASTFDTANAPILSLAVTGTIVQSVSTPEPYSGSQLAIGLGLLGGIGFLRRLKK